MIYKTFYYSQSNDGVLDFYLNHMKDLGWYFESFYPEFRCNAYNGFTGRILFTMDDPPKEPNNVDPGASQ